MRCFTCGCCPCCTKVPDRYERPIHYDGESDSVYDTCWFKTLKWSLIVIFSLLLLAFIIIFVTIPLVFMNNVDLQRKLMFLDVDDPKDPQYTNYLEYNITGVQNYYATVYENREKVRLGIWQILPEDQIEESKAPNFSYETALRTSKKPILIFFHGQAATRITNVPKYNVLRKFFHILAFDYRHFADSTEAPMTEKGVVNDAIQLYEDIVDKTEQREIYIWGHSLGTALGTHTVRKLFELNTLVKPRGLFLEAAFSTMREEVPENPLGKVFKWLPWFAATILNPLEKNDLTFATTENILYVECPVFIIHADDDNVIPTKLSKKVYEAAQKRKVGSNTQEYHLVPSHFGLSHLKIEEYPELPNLIEKFLKRIHQAGLQPS